MRIPRRSVLALVVGGALGSAGIVRSQEDDETLSRDSYPILEGTEHETTVYVTTSSTDGPTVLVVGGIHGDEPAGWIAADEIAEWDITAGTLVTIPEANQTAIEAGTRRGSDGTDLNRQFPTGQEPTTELARAIWDVVLRYEPDAVIDLHESTGIYAGDPIDGVGQAIFRSGEAEAVEAADRAVEYVNENYVDDPELEFMTGGFTGPETEPEGLLVHKASRETHAMGFLVETLRTDIDIDVRVHWQTVIAQQLTVEWLFDDESDIEVEEDDPPEVDEDEEPDDDDTPEVDEDEPDADDEDDEPPTARIQTDPPDAEDAVLDLDQTVTLDATESSEGTSSIVHYEWDVGGEGEFDEEGESIEVTVAKCGEYPVVLRVTDENELSATAEITLRTVE